MLPDRGDLAIEVTVQNVDEVSAGSRSDSAVKPRRSDSQIAAFIVSGSRAGSGRP